MRASYPRLTVLVAAGVLLVGATACGDDDSSDASTGSGGNSSDSSGSDNGGSTTQAIEITSPADGDAVDGTFDVDFASSEDLGPTDTGKHHVHLFFDGSDDYEVVETPSYTVDELDAGEHTIKAALANADHSLTGDETEITVEVGSGGSGGAGSSDTTTDDSPDY
ncbi:MAG TPA: hypothetical protein VK611_13875 [Acidimicrobiales bacterium]|nr:hypothetical protein [Acidimicrobiales bacterium]